MRKTIIALGLLAGIAGTADVASAQYYEDGYRPRYRERYYDGPPRYYAPRYRRAACPANLVPDNYGRCVPWRPTRGSECLPGYTVQDGRCKPYTGR